MMATRRMEICDPPKSVGSGTNFGWHGGHAVQFGSRMNLSRLLIIF